MLCKSYLADAWLVDDVWHASIELDGKAVQGIAPIVNRFIPFFADIL